MKIHMENKVMPSVSSPIETADYAIIAKSDINIPGWQFQDGDILYLKHEELKPEHIHACCVIQNENNEYALARILSIDHENQTFDCIISTYGNVTTFSEDAFLGVVVGYTRRIRGT